MDIKKIYSPYNYSKTRCFIITIRITGTGVYKIESRFPHQAKVLKGIYISCSGSFSPKVIGQLNLFMNEGILKNFQYAVIKSHTLRYHSRPIPLNEEILPNSSLQGVFYQLTAAKSYPFTLKIYLHYEEEL